MRTRLILASALLGSSLAVQADSIDFNVGDKAVRATYAHNVDSSYKGLQVDAGWLYTDDTNTREEENMFHLGLGVSGENWSEKGSFDIHIGGRLPFTSIDGEKFLGLALGGSVRFSPIERIGFGGHIYHAPEILSFLDSDQYTEYGVKIDYQLLPQAFVYLGYRDVEFEHDSGADVELNDSAMIGVTMMF